MTNANNLLLVDDEQPLVTALTPALHAEGYAVTSVGDGAGALDLLSQGSFAVVLLDLGLPDLDGQEIIRRVREWSDVPIVVLSAREREQEKIIALDSGADDYVSKPFAIGELMARLRAARRGRDLRRSGAPAACFGPLKIDLARRKVEVAGRELRLTPREYDLLRTFARHAGAALTHSQIIAAVWGNGEADAQSVRVLVGQLRQKLNSAGAPKGLIRTEAGIGYRFASDT